MTITTKTGETIETQTPPMEWLALSEDPVGDEPLVFRDDGETIFSVREGDELDVVNAGSGFSVEPKFDRDRVDEMLAEEFGNALDADDREALLDWYESFVADIIEDDLLNLGCKTTFVEDTAYLGEMDADFLADEIAEEMGGRDWNVAREIATTVADWWDGDAPVDNDAFAATVKLSD